MPQATIPRGAQFFDPVLKGRTGVARLAADSGSTMWQTTPGTIADLVSSSPAVVGGEVLFGMNGDRYQTLDVGTGATGWHVDTVGNVALSAPLVVGDTAYFVPGGKTAALYAASRSGGGTTQVRASPPIRLDSDSLMAWRALSVPRRSAPLGRS